ncbi:MAG: ABC-ATPase domain-containing protein [Thermodesulfobacteriota bacterium]
MKSSQHLKESLHRIDRKGYKAYKDIETSYDFGHYILSVDHVQGDPFAAPSRISVIVSQAQAALPCDLFVTKVRNIALCDYLAREFNQAVKSIAKGRRGIGKSGYIGIDHSNQEVLERTSILIDGEAVEARFFMGLPAAGRTILGREAEAMFFDELPAIVSRSLFYRNLRAEAVMAHVEAVEDQVSIRDQLHTSKLVAFVGNGSILPRRSGIDDRPLIGDGNVVIPFCSPEEMEVEFDTPNRGRVRGMGIPQGVTLIVGGGFHGKSTLLHALERGVYSHIPGDGRELVATLTGAVKIRAEDGRSVERVDISPFISNLPYRSDTTSFSTENASGSTSQVANIMEALEMGAELLLMDEDTCATNLMIRDRRMQELVAKEKEPITPYIDKVRQLHRELGVSTILVMGGAGDYFDVADTVIMLDSYRPREVTSQVEEIRKRHRSMRESEGGAQFGTISERVPIATSFNPARGKRAVKIDAKGVRTILFGAVEIDLSDVEQLIDMSQTRAIGDMIHHLAQRCFTNDAPLKEAISRMMVDIDKRGLDILSPLKRGDYARPRIFEVAAAINRMRSLKVKG